MKNKNPELISSPNLSVAWQKAFTLAMNSRLCPAMIVTVSGFTGNLPDEDPTTRKALDEALRINNKVCVEDTAFTIFPYSTWLRYQQQPRSRFFQRYRDMYPRLIARDKQKYGTYFYRLINYDGLYHNAPRVVNQLEHIIGIWNRDRNSNKHPRFSALQASLFDPAKDHTGQPVRGFPCLQQVGFSYDKAGELTVCAFYPSQYIFDRAYGNYLGLCHLGLFMAHEMRLRFSCLEAFIAAPVLSGDTAKRKLQSLADALPLDSEKIDLPRAS